MSVHQRGCRAWSLAILGLTTLVLGLRTARGEDLPCPVDGVDSVDEIVDLVDCVLNLIHEDTFNALDPEMQEAFQGYADVFERAAVTVNVVLHEWVVPNLSEDDRAAFVFVVQNGTILEEIVELQHLLGFGASRGPQPGTDDAKKEAEKSIKELLNKLVDMLPDGEIVILPKIHLPWPIDRDIGPWSVDLKWLKQFVKVLFDAINEVLQAIRGGGGKKVTQAHTIGPYPNDVPVGASEMATAVVQAGFAAAPGQQVVFTRSAGHFTFTSGDISPDGSTSTVMSDRFGLAPVTFVADEPGEALLQVSVSGSPVSVFSFFKVVAAKPASETPESDDTGASGASTAPNEETAAEDLLGVTGCAPGAASAAAGALVGLAALRFGRRRW